MLKKILQEKAARESARLGAATDVSQEEKLIQFWKPHPGPQSDCYYSECDEILYGGAAGSGKSALIIALMVKYCHIPKFLGVVMRRESPQLDDLINKSWELFPKVYPKARFNKSERRWTFPSGAQVKFGHCARDTDYKKYDGFEINLYCPDELTHYTETIYKAVSGRVRSSGPGTPKLIRCTTNPGGPGNDWVFRHWGPWLDPEFAVNCLEPRFNDDGKKIPAAEPNQILWVDNRGDEPVWFTEDQNDHNILSRTFIPGRLEDNPSLLENDPQYIGRLNNLDPVRRAQLLNGDWTIQMAPGLYFKGAWCTFLDRAPANLRLVRAWDLAATEVHDGNKNPDWTAGVLMGMNSDGEVFILDVERIRANPGDVKRRIRQVADMDGENVRVSYPIDPGQAGVAQDQDYAKLLTGLRYHSSRETGDKETRFSPFSAAASHGLVTIVQGPWNKKFIDELESFPLEGYKRDQVDATSRAFNLLAEGHGQGVITSGESTNWTREIDYGDNGFNDADDWD